MRTHLQLSGLFSELSLSLFSVPLIHTLVPCFVGHIHVLLRLLSVFNLKQLGSREKIRQSIEKHAMFVVKHVIHKRSYRDILLFEDDCLCKQT